MCIAEPGCITVQTWGLHSIRPIDGIWSLSLAVMRAILDLFDNEACFLSLDSKSDRRSRNCECSEMERNKDVRAVM
jgi:hypothetical protein